jgi:ATP-dependent helicase/nuclease subunit B
MSKFLQTVAKKLNAAHQGDFRDVVVVVPARRSMLFLQKYLSAEVGKTYWMPNTFIFPQFIEWMASRSIVSGAEALMDLYVCYRQTVSQPATFDIFSTWAATALKDFGDIDGSLANSKQVFSNLQSVREIDSWSFNSEELTSAQKQFISFWDELGKLYEAYSYYQSETERWSYNMLIRWLLEQGSFMEERVRGKKVYFIGIASFSPAEMTLIEKVKSFSEVEILWDIDAYYIEDTMQEAGYFARKARERFGALSQASRSLTDSKTVIQVYETTTAIGQCYGAAELLSKMSAQELEQTCVVLADEKLAEPLLSSITREDVAINLAIGVPLNTTTIAQWIGTTLHIRQKLLQENRGIYHKDFVEWLHLSVAVGVTSENVLHTKQVLIEQLWIYIQHDQLKSQIQAESRLAQLIGLLFEAKNDDVISNMRHHATVAANEAEQNSMERYTTRSMAALLDRLSVLLKRFDFLNEASTLHVLWNQLLSGEVLQYEGEPVNGLQILGLRETRALDFDTIILLGANEETLPGNVVQQSFIPFELRGYYKLPMPHEQEYMVAYMFYRLLQSPSSVHVFYSTISSDFKGTEQSRYITQIENELTNHNPQITVQRYQLKLADAAYEHSSQSVKATPYVHQVLDRLFEKGISPSAINKFNACPLDFYYRYILGLGEEETIEEQMSAATFGSIVHHVLEKFFEAFKGAYPSVEDFEQLKSTLDERLNEAFEEIYATHTTGFGYNYLASKVAKDMLERFIGYELKLAKEREAIGVKPAIVDIEMSLRKEVPIQQYDWSKPVAIRGLVDRLETIAGQVRILDYKTGKVKDTDVRLNKPIADIMKSDKHGKLLQLLCYIYMYSKDGREPENMTAGFYSFVAHKNGFMMFEDKMTVEKLHEFEQAFMDWVKQVYATEVFEHNPDSKFCEYCR